MAQPLQSINLVAPAFKGINTEDSPLQQDPSFADVADNAIIDKRGRIAARKGNKLFTTDNTALGGNVVEQMHYFYDDAGNTKLFSAANNKIFSGTTTLTDETPVSYTITSNNWRMVNFNNAAYFFQRGHQPLIYTHAGGLQTFNAFTGGTMSTNLYCHEALAAYGRLWVVDNGSNTQVIYWSDLLIGTDFTGGSSGSIDVSKVWPDGYDEVIGLAAHNNLLIVFGKHSILVYQGASSPATMSLADTVAGVGCSCRNSIQHIGTDVLFVSPSGLRSFGRTIQEKSMPISDLSANIKTEFVEAEQLRTQPTKSVYSPENSFYLLAFPEDGTVYCFDLKGRLENNSYRVTRWTNAPFTCFERLPNGDLYTGSVYGVGEYTGYADQYIDDGSIIDGKYRFRYYSPGLTFGDPSKLKILKKLRPTIVGGNSSSVSIGWSYDLTEDYTFRTVTIGDQTPYYYGVAEYGIAEYSAGIFTSRKQINATSGGSIVTIAVEADIQGFPLSLQEINVQAMIGKTL